MKLLQKYMWVATVFFYASSFAQNAYKEGSTVKDFAIGTMLNNNAKLDSFKQLQKDITIIDFFGTWCAPCIKAIPHLQELQKKFGDKISIVLISTEEKDKLSAFIKNRSGFSFPLIVDGDESITQLFQPPSYPYSVVVNKDGTILSISNAAALNEAAIENWLTVKKAVPMPVVPTKKEDKPIEQKPATATPKRTSNKLVQLSQDFMYAAKTNGNAADFVKQLKIIPYENLIDQLKSDDDKKAFWINAYNGFTQYFLKQNKEAYKIRSKFFGAEQIVIAGKNFSLDDIEHGILRHSKIKWAEGYLNKWFPSKKEKALRVEKLDYRLHFALNCGAQSCPPIAFYNPENINTQLDVATKAFLSSEAKYDAGTNILELPKLMSWFRKDFGGKKKMKVLAKQLGIVPYDKNPSIKFKNYSWNLYLDNYEK
ncbi:MAG: DUF547 domain-containing protein [Chitinophagaceae bacterium]|nr:DUF547 domain-containing protein [Chitinophagaceae bacterium]